MPVKPSDFRSDGVKHPTTAGVCGVEVGVVDVASDGLLLRTKLVTLPADTTTVAPVRVLESLISKWTLKSLSFLSVFFRV